MGKTTRVLWMGVLVLGLGWTASADDSVEARWSGTLDIPNMDEVTRSLEVSGAPADAYVTKVDFALIVDDRGNEALFWCSDYEIYIGNETRGPWYHCVWDNQGGWSDEDADHDDPDDSDILLLPPWSSLSTEFDGDPVNQKWYVAIKDNVQGHESGYPGIRFPGIGRLIRFEVRIWYRVPGPDLVDSDFSASIDSADLRADAAGQDWYESRWDAPSLVTLNVANIGGNNTAKAAFAASSAGNAYLTQEFSQPVTQGASIQWDIYVASILYLPEDPDRGAWMLIGDDTGTDLSRIGPNAEDDERFVYLGFSKNGGGSSGTMDLVARDRDDSWDDFTTVASDLNMAQWYTIEVSLNFLAGTYDVYVDGEYKATVTSRHPKSSVTHVSFAQWDDGAGGFYVDNVTAKPSAVGQNVDNRAYDVAVQSDGKIVVVGTRIANGDGDFAVARYNTDGSLDHSFSGDGVVTTNNPLGWADAECVIIQPDGKIIAAGSWEDDESTFDEDFALVRYNTDGSLDRTFGFYGIVTTDFGALSRDHVYDIALQPDGKIVVAGTTDINGLWDFALARYDRSGNLDPTFSGDGRVVTPIGTDMDMAYCVAIRPDGKIVVAGEVWDEINWDYEVGLARYNANGSLDLSFSGNGKLTWDISGKDDVAESMALQPDGKIVLAGSTVDGGRDVFLLARCNASGTPDTSFAGTGVLRVRVGPSDDGAYDVALQPDGKIVAAGYSIRSSANGYLDFGLVRCNPNGTLDESFGLHGIVTTDFASSWDWAYGLAFQSDGKIVLAGYTAEFKPPESYDKFDFALARYHTDGSLDLSFSGDGKVTTDLP